MFQMQNAPEQKRRRCLLTIQFNPHLDKVHAPTPGPRVGYSMCVLGAVFF